MHFDTETEALKWNAVVILLNDFLPRMIFLILKICKVLFALNLKFCLQKTDWNEVYSYVWLFIMKGDWM